MGRQIRTSKMAVASNGGALPSMPASAAKAIAETIPPDKYTDRVLKYIPADIIAIYITLMGIADASLNNETWKVWLPWAIFGSVLALTPVYLVRVAKISARVQVAIATGAFVVWAVSLGSPFDQHHIQWFEPVLPALLLPFYTFVVGVIEP